MVSNYNKQKGYILSNLVKELWFLSDESSKLINIDGNDANVSEIDDDILSLFVNAVEVEEETSLDERWQFVHTLSFKVSGQANADLIGNRKTVIFKTLDGAYFLLNPDLRADLSYIYSANKEGVNETTFRLAIASNHPMLEVTGFNETTTSAKYCGYVHAPIKRLFLNEFNYTMVGDEMVSITNDGFKEIEFNDITIEYSTSDQYQTTISFTITFDNYKKDFPWHLIEFSDNEYVALLQSNDGIKAYGFNNGLIPSYSVSTNSDESGTITFTLREISTSSSSMVITGTTNYTILTWNFTTKYGFECAEDGLGMYLVQAEEDLFGNESGRYKVKSGYEQQFPELNIVGTFTDTVLFATSDCAKENPTNCAMNTSIPAQMSFSSTTMPQYFSVSGSTNWTITKSGNVTVTPTGGSANQIYFVSVQATSTATSNANVTLNYCNNGQHKTCTCQLRGSAASCFPNGTGKTIDANGGTVQFLSKCPLYSVAMDTAYTSVATAYTMGNYVVVRIPVNPTEYSKGYTMVATMLDGTTVRLNVTQTPAVVNWIEDGVICDGNDLYARLVAWTGVTAEYLVPTDIFDVGDLIEEESQECVAVQTRWVTTEQTFCSNAKLYIVEKQQITYDAGITWRDTGNTRLGQEILDTQNICGGQTTYEYRWVLSDQYVCRDGSVPSQSADTPSVTDYKIMASYTNGQQYSLSCSTMADSITSAITNTTNPSHQLMSSVTIGDCVTAISGRSFYNANAPFTALTDVTIGSGCIYIGDDAFYSATSVTSITINSVQYIYEGAFSRMTGLTSITLPQNLRSIGDFALANCSGLQAIYINALTPPTLGYNCFSGTNACPIYVPSAAFNAYWESLEWSTYASRLRSI